MVDGGTLFKNSFHFGAQMNISNLNKFFVSFLKWGKNVGCVCVLRGCVCGRGVKLKEKND